MLITMFGKQYDVELIEAKYGDGSIALEVIDSQDGEPFGRLTVCVPDTRLNENEVLVKTWSENQEWASQFLKYGFEDTGRRVKTGYVEAQVWKRTPQ